MLRGRGRVSHGHPAGCLGKSTSYDPSRIAPRVALALLAVASACAHHGDTIVTRSAPHMGTVVTLTVAARDESTGVHAIERAFAEIARLEQMLSSYRPASDLNRLNAQAGTGPVRVPRELSELTFAAAAIAAQTAGAFNPLMGPAIKLWGIPHDPHVPSPGELRALLPLIELTGLGVRPKQATIALALPGMALGLGGIAKGYTADRVVGLLQAEGMHGGVVEISGDVRTFGLGPGRRPWRVGVRDPRGSRAPLVVMEITDGAVSTSGDYERFFELEGVRYHHILDPRTLMPARGLISVTVLAPRAIDADALATAVLVMGAVEGLALVERSAGIEALLIDRDQQRLVSTGWPAPIQSPAAAR